MTINFTDIPLFSSLTRIDRSRMLPHFTILEFSAGETIVQQGQMSDSLFVIASGMVRVTRHQQDGSCIDIATLQRGECFGEVALLTGEPRSADVLAVGEQTVVMRLSRARFKDLMKQYNELAIKIAGILAQRVSRTTGHVLETFSLPSEDLLIALTENAKELPSSAGLKAGWSLSVQLRNRRFISSAIALLLCGITLLILRDKGMTTQQIVLFELLLGATVVWSFDAFSYHAVALALPLAAVLLKAAPPSAAFAGFSHPSWFLVLGVFAISAAISRTGLMYRLVLLVLKNFPASYRWQSFGLALAGLVLTPVIPSSNGRAVLAGPLVSSFPRSAWERNELTLRVTKHHQDAERLSSPFPRRPWERGKHTNQRRAGYEPRPYI